MKQTLKEIGEILIAIEDGAGWGFKIGDVWNSGDGHDPVYRLYYQNEIRLQPRTIRIGEYDVPEPIRKAPKYGVGYWATSILDSEFRKYAIWEGDDDDCKALNRGLIHATAEAAALHGKVLASLTSTEPIE